ncbi:MAG: SDR family oxidoreductase [Chloroflexi bacterium]|nr:SDR family oxidoreductase [Chloroflexota bacterium]
MELTHQRVVIMGGSSGIGLATARMLVEAGAEVAITGRSQDKIDAAVAQLGEHATGAVVDATSLPDLRAFFQAYGPFLHLVIAVSGAAGAGAFRQLDLAELRRGFEQKFWAQVAAAQISLDTLQPNGSLTFITAGSARAALPETAGLAAINGALNAMIPTLALELRPLRVNAVSPGVIATPWWDRVGEQFRNNYFAQTAASVPVGRVGQPEDVAQAILFLIQNGFVTGTIIDCDGGAHLK